MAMDCLRYWLSILCFCILLNFGICSTVPVFIWGKQNIGNFPPVAAMETINARTFQDNYIYPLLNDRQTLIIYIQDTLSPEDLTNLDDKTIFKNLKDYLDEESLLLPSVNNPTGVFSKLEEKYKVKQIHLNESYIEDIASIVEKNNVVIIHSSDEDMSDRSKVLNSVDNFMKKVQKSVAKVKKSITYLLTGYNPSWDISSDEMRIARHLLSVSDSANGTLLNFTNCAYLFTHNVFMILERNTTQIPEHFNITVEFTNERCDTFESTMQLYADIKLDNVKELKKATLILVFNLTVSDWLLTNTELQIVDEDGDNTIPLKTSKIEAPKKFSYSCYQQILKVINGSQYDGNITFDVFQVQPFLNGTFKFSESFDCVTFFTIPIWMGFLVVLLLTIILAFGIYMLFNIHTMDRFDDPKGKTISVPITD